MKTSFNSASRLTRLLSLGLGIGVLSSPFASAATYTSSAGTGNPGGNWSQTTLWNGGVVPTSSQDNTLVFISPTGVARVTTNNLGTFQLNRLTMTNNSSATNNQTLSIAGTVSNGLVFVQDSNNVLPTIEFGRGTTNGGRITLSAPITVTDALTITNSAAASTQLTTISSAIANNAGMTFNGSGPATFTLGNGVVSGAGGIAFNGSYTVVSTGANTYTGQTVVSAGTLLVNNSHTISSGPASATAYNITGGTLGGTGTINLSAVNSGVTLGSGAKLAPGASVESLAFSLGTGVLDTSGAVGGSNVGGFVFELGASTVPGTDYDQVIVNATGAGGLNIGSGILEDADFSFSQLAGFGTGVYTLFDTDTTMIGSLGSDVTVDFGSGLTGTLSLANGNQDLILTVVPEPGSVALIAMGAISLVLHRARRRRF